MLQCGADPSNDKGPPLIKPFLIAAGPGRFLLPDADGVNDQFRRAEDDQIFAARSTSSSTSTPLRANIASIVSAASATVSAEVSITSSLAVGG